MKTFKVSIPATDKTHTLNSPTAVAYELEAAKRNAGFVVGENAIANWTAQLERMGVGDTMGYAMPAASGGIADFARVERVV